MFIIGCVFCLTAYCIRHKEMFYKYYRLENSLLAFKSNAFRDETVLKQTQLIFYDYLKQTMRYCE